MRKRSRRTSRPPIDLRVLAWLAALAVGLAGPGARAADTISYRTNSPWSDPAFFPLGVWLQDPANAERYRQAGFNLYIGLWDGPTEEQLSAMDHSGLYVVCAQNSTGLEHLADTNIIGWMHGDEPDNAQSEGARLGFGAPVLPGKVVAEYQRLKQADPSRPVLLNLGQGVAWDDWYGRGDRTHHPEDYPEYVQGCDIASFDIYPVVHSSKEVAGKLWYVGRGVQRLADWCGTNRLVWNCIECTHISNPDRKPTPAQVRSEVWMSLIEGSRGLIFFVHQFKPQFREAALLDDPDMLAAVTALNQQIMGLAPMLNSPTVPLATVQPENHEMPIALMAKRHDGVTYLFTVAMQAGGTSATFRLKDPAGDQTVEVLGENRTLKAGNGIFTDHFGPYEVHLYRLKPGT